MDLLIQGMALLANRYSLKINERQDMEMKKKEGSKLTAIAYSGLAISILSAFTTIVGYTNSSGIHRSWHEVEDRATMQLVPTKIHDSARHSGGVAQAKYEMAWGNVAIDDSAL